MPVKALTPLSKNDSQSGREGELRVKPETLALINVDMQNRFVQGTPGALAVLPNINRLLALCHSAGILVVHTRHIFAQDGMNAPALAALHQDLLVGQQDILLDKQHFDAFHETMLEEILRTHGIATVMITGLRTNACCQMTAYAAALRNFEVFFLSDGTAAKPLDDVTAEDLHKAACATISAYFGQVLMVDAMVNLIAKSL